MYMLYASYIVVILTVCFPQNNYTTCFHSNFMWYHKHSIYVHMLHKVLLDQRKVIQKFEWVYCNVLSKYSEHIHLILLDTYSSGTIHENLASFKNGLSPTRRFQINDATVMPRRWVTRQWRINGTLLTVTALRALRPSVPWTYFLPQPVQFYSFLGIKIATLKPDVLCTEASRNIILKAQVVYIWICTQYWWWSCKHTFRFTQLR